MWCGTVRAHRLEQRLAAAATDGYDELSIAPSDVAVELEAGRSFADIRAMQAHYGVRLSHLDPVTTWAPRWQPESSRWSDQAGLDDFLGRDVETFLLWARQIGAWSISAIVSASLTPQQQTSLTPAFRDLCAQAAQHGLRVDLEFIPFWGMPDLRSAVEVVERAGATNSGIVFDTWHFFRGAPDLDLLRHLPPGSITGVQVADAVAPNTSVTAMQDCLENRVTPGSGDFDLVSVLRVLAETGNMTRVGPEVFSLDYDAMTPTQASAEATDATADLLNLSGVRHGLRPVRLVSS